MRGLFGTHFFQKELVFQVGEIISVITELSLEAPILAALSLA